MSDHELNDKQQPIGFAGLATMVSSVDDIVTQELLKGENTTESAAPTNVAAPVAQYNEPSSSTLQPAMAASSEKKEKKARNWIITIVGAAAVLWFINKPDSSSSSYTASDASTQFTNVPPPAPAPVQPVLQTPPEDTSITEKPPVGKNLVLNRAQLRYCQAEKIRLEAGREELSTHVNPSNKRFNKFVDDFNVRCSSYRYYQQDLDNAISDVQERLYQYQSEGRTRFQRSR